jgi:hypothetical protein
MRGQRFVLCHATVAIGFDESGKRVAVTIPARAEITVPDIVPIEPRIVKKLDLAENTR